MMRPRLLDLFACEGGGSAGYARAGWIVTAVDVNANRLKYNPSPTKVVADALDYARKHAHEYDAIHASPPCQAYTRGNAGRATTHPRLIGPTRAVLEATGLPYVIENVTDAGPELRNPKRLCGCQFDLRTYDTDGTLLHLKRERLFETNFPMRAPKACQHRGISQWAGAYGGARRNKHEARSVRHGGYVPPDKEVVSNLLGVEHPMTWEGLFECLPPSYTEHIGSSLIEHIGTETGQGRLW